MATIARGTKAGGGTNFNSGQTIDPAEVNTDLNTIYTEFNGNIENSNVKAAAAIALTKIAHYGARVYNSANISIANATNTALTFDTERYDTDALHSTTTNTNRLTAPAAGKYLITGHVEWGASATGQRYINVRFNGTTVIAQQHVINLNNTVFSQSIATIYSLAANDFVELVVFQDSGGALNVQANSALSPEFTIAFLGA